MCEIFGSGNHVPGFFGEMSRRASQDNQVWLMMLRVLGLLAFACCLKHGSLWVFWHRFYWQTCLAVSQDSNPNLLEMLQFIKEPSWISFETHPFDIITIPISTISHMESVSPIQVLKKRQNLLAWLPVEKDLPVQVA